MVHNSDTAASGRARPDAGLQRGDRVELLAVPADPDYQNAGLTAGQRGAADLVDSLRTVHARWDSGQRLGITDRHRALLRLAAAQEAIASINEQLAARLPDDCDEYQRAAEQARETARSARDILPVLND